MKPSSQDLASSTPPHSTELSLPPRSSETPKQETHDRPCEEFGIFDKGPDSYRRNVIVEGQDLNELIKQEFEIQGVRFVGTEEAKPCFWMNEALCPGAEKFLMGKGGLRARILTDGVLKNSFS